MGLVIGFGMSFVRLGLVSLFILYVVMGIVCCGVMVCFGCFECYFLIYSVDLLLDGFRWNVNKVFI